MHGSQNRPAALEQVPCGQKKGGEKKKKKDKEELSEVKARAVACLVLGADT